MKVNAYSIFFTNIEIGRMFSSLPKKPMAVRIRKNSNRQNEIVRKKIIRFNFGKGLCSGFRQTK